MKDVGVVMPVYTQVPEYLKLALQSMLNQSYEHFHFVIVSDGASAKTVKQIKEITEGDSRVHLIEKEKNEGVPKALNTGFHYLMSIREIKYFTWVSSDNIYYPTFLEQHRNTLEQAPKHVGLSFSSFRHIDANGEQLKEPQLKEFYDYQNQPKENLVNYCFIGVSFMYKKRYAAMIEGYKLAPVEDYEYWLRITEVCDIQFIPEVLMEYRTESPLSVSAQVKHSKDGHRKWRYAFNLARYEARQRRHIAPFLTIIFPVDDQMSNVETKFEDLLEQTYSNFNFIIIDCSRNHSVTDGLQPINDPRLTFLQLPSGTKEEAVQLGLERANTPLTMVYGKGAFPSSPWDLNNLIIQFQQDKYKSLSPVTSYEQIIFEKLYFTTQLSKVKEGLQL